MTTAFTDTDNGNFLRQRSIDNLTYTWTDGLLNNLNVKMLDDERVGLRACFYPGPIDGANLDGTIGLAGIRVFAATSETTFDQLAWRSGLSKWVWEQRWMNLNGHASPACMGWGRGSVTYAMFVNEQNAVNVLWYVSKSCNAMRSVLKFFPIGKTHLWANQAQNSIR